MPYREPRVEVFSVREYGGEAEARRARDARARELRARGCEVRCWKRDFSDLVRDVAYGLEWVPAPGERGR